MTDDLEDCKKENKLLREQLDLCIDMGKLITKKLDKIKWRHIHTAPKDGKPFLAHMGNGDIEIVIYTNHGWRLNAYAPPLINEDWMKQWMPLPAGPKGE
jgi:hypothetical protein